jgi:transposase
MNKTEQFRLRAVLQFLAGQDGTQRTADSLGINRSRLRQWINAYEVHGADGLRDRSRQSYDCAVKLRVLQHMWDNELSYKQTTAVFNLGSPTTVGQWERRYRASGPDGLAPASQPRRAMIDSTEKPHSPVPDEQRSREDLLKEVHQLRMENEYLKKLRALVQADSAKALKKRK